jgi:hypothetical protein
MISIAKGLFWFGIFIVSLTLWALIVYRSAILYWMLAVGVLLLIATAIVVDKYGRP